MTPKLCYSISKLCQNHPTIELLGLSHCQIDKVMLKELAKDLQMSSVRYLDLAWNHFAQSTDSE